jgi:hypothetical protein
VSNIADHDLQIGTRMQVGVDSGSLLFHVDRIQSHLQEAAIGSHGVGCI